MTRSYSPNARNQMRGNTGIRGNPNYNSSDGHVHFASSADDYQNRPYSSSGSSQGYNSNNPNYLDPNEYSPHPVNPTSGPPLRRGNTVAVQPDGSIRIDQAQLDALGQALQFSVASEDRKCKKTRKKFRACFLGSDAVDILMTLGKFQTRYQALAVGRLLQENKNMFDCVNSPKVYQLEDDKRLFYEFTTNTTAGTTRPKNDALLINLEEKMRVFQRGVKVKDRSHRLTTYKNCFVGKEAVDLMMRNKMASTRQECVELGRILKQKYNLFLPVTGVHDFEDEYVKKCNVFFCVVLVCTGYFGFR